MRDRADELLDPWTEDYFVDPADEEEEGLTPEQKERNWMMLWKVREQKFALPLRMLLNVPERAFFDPLWGPLLQTDKHGRVQAGSGLRHRGFFSDIGPGLIGIETPIDVCGPATYRVWYTAKMGGHREFIVEGVSLEEAREAILKKSEKEVLVALEAEQP
jgi:hypothetical protein